MLWFAYEMYPLSKYIMLSIEKKLRVSFKDVSYWDFR